MNESTQPPRTLVHEDEFRTESRNFYLQPDDGIQVPGPGSLDTFVVIGDSTNFGVRVETEDTTVVDEGFDRLSSWSGELDHIDAYDSGGQHVISVTNIPYREGARAEVKVSGQVTFEWVRGVFVIGREADY